MGSRCRVTDHLPSSPAMIAAGKEGAGRTGSKVPVAPSERGPVRRHVRCPQRRDAMDPHRADLVTDVDPVEQLRQHWAVAVGAGGKLHRPDVGGAQAGHHPGLLPKRQPERERDGQTGTDRHIREPRGPFGAADMRRKPGHPLVRSGTRRPTFAKRNGVAGPVHTAVAVGGRLAHSACPTAWILDVNPSSRDFCNIAEGAPPARRPFGLEPGPPDSAGAGP